MCISIEKSILDLYCHVVAPFIFIEIILVMFCSRTVFMARRHFLVDILLIPYCGSISPSLFLQDIGIERKTRERERERRIPQLHVMQRDHNHAIYSKGLCMCKEVPQPMLNTARIRSRSQINTNNLRKKGTNLSYLIHGVIV